ncbi:MAG: cytochrome c maturation protein CcmE [Actinomycetota bacterium]|nr:cytochrome c maturation protein CcmE [Actinomycetota bacterium]
MVDSKSKKRLLIVTVILLAIIGYMIYNSSVSSYSYYKSVSEVAGNSSYIGKSIRVSGKIVERSPEHINGKYVFHIYEKDKKLTIVYSGPQLPQTFGKDITAVAEGKLVSPNRFEAKSVITKCPSKYDTKKKEGQGKSEKSGGK